METLNSKEKMQKVIVSFRAKAIMEFPISQDISNLTKEEMQELIKNIYNFIEIKVESCKELKF